MSQTDGVRANRWAALPASIPQVMTAALAALSVSCGGNPTSPAAPTPTPGGAPTVSGTFEFTFTSDPSCTQLPLQARRRTYTATLREGRSTAQLGGATFIPAAAGYPAWNVVYTSVTREAAEIWFQDPPIWEALPDHSYVLIYGDAHGQIGPDESSTLPFWARFEYCPDREYDSYPECEVPVVTCESRNHQLVVRRIN